MKSRNIFIWQLPKTDIFRLYKAIKKALIELEVFSYNNLIEVMNGRLTDCEDNINLDLLGF